MKKIFVLFLIFSSLFCQDFLKIEDCIKIAVSQNLNLKITKDKIEESYYQKEIARKYSLPFLSFSFNYLYLGENEGIQIGNFPPVKFVEDNQYIFKLTLNQPLFTGKKIETNYEISKESYEKAKIDYEKQLNDLIFDVKRSYFEILKAKRLLQTSEKYKESLEKHLQDAKILFNQGLVTKLDILKTEVALKDAETKIIECENYLKISKSNLNFILNRDINSEFDIEDILEIKEDEKPYDFWKETALKERDEIKSFEKILSIYEKNIRVEKSNLYPQVYFFFNYNLEKGTQTSREDFDTNWNTGILLSYDIWNWGQTKDKIEKAKKEKEEIEKNYQLLKNSIELEVKNSYLNFLSSKEKVEKSKKEIELAEENLRIAQLLYREGMATTTDVIDAINSLTNAKNNYYNSLYDYKISYNQLKKVCGILKMEVK